MEEKQALPPAYTDVSTGPPPPHPSHNYNAGCPGFPPVTGGGYPPNYGYPGYPPQEGVPLQQSGSGGFDNKYRETDVVVLNQPGPRSMPVTQVPDNMNLAIFTTICCCWPLGLVAILRASESRRCLAAGDVTSATRYGRQARTYSYWAIGLGIVSLILSVVLLTVMILKYKDHMLLFYTG